MKLDERLWSLHTFLKKAANQPALHAAAAVSSSMSVKIFYFVKYKSYENNGRKLYFRNLMNQKTESFHKVKSKCYR